MELGFSFGEREYPNAPGALTLEINLYGEPTEEHFDPKEVSIPLITEGGFLEEMTLFHPWPYESQYRVGPGDVVMYDRKENEERAFTFGGLLFIERKGDKTCCKLVSTAPILYITDMVEMPTILANEVEVLISERGAAWLPESDFHNLLLAKVDPLVFYAVCLKEVREKYELLEQQDLEYAQALHTFVRQEITALKAEKRWPDKTPALELLI